MRQSATADHGKWVDIPNEIGPNTTSVFRLKDPLGPTRTQGQFSFSILHGAPNVAQNKYLLTGSFVCANFNSELNSFDVPPITPVALYVLTCHARSGKGRGTYPYHTGHPLHVEITVDYQSTRYEFQVERITAPLEHPILNTRDIRFEDSDEPHELWNRSEGGWMDGQRGSFQPNVFRHDFISELRTALTVTVRAMSTELLGAEVRLHGRAPGSGVAFRSSYFVIDTLTNIPVAVRITEPHTSAKPFALNADVEWGMTLKLSGGTVTCVEPNSTRLELYWVAQSLHQAFVHGGIPVEFLRIVLQSPSGHHVHITNSYDWNREMTRKSFEDYRKIYDSQHGMSIFELKICSKISVAGKSHFGVVDSGGSFDLAMYLARDPSGRPGGARRTVNCMDQAAILELSCSLGHRDGDPPMNWVAHHPYGYINSTHLVGVRDQSGELIRVNNPFF